jgi:ribonuclease BN (tRNA processing enzyme)
LIVNGTPYLIDAGDGVARRLVQAGIDFTKIGRVFITHNHSDHTMGIPNLISVEWQYARREPVAFYGPPGTEETVKAALVFANVDAAIRLSETQVTPIEKIVEAHNVGTGQIYQDSNITVTAVENTHFHSRKAAPPTASSSHTLIGLFRPAKSRSSSLAIPARAMLSPISPRGQTFWSRRRYRLMRSRRVWRKRASGRR